MTRSRNRLLVTGIFFVFCVGLLVVSSASAAGQSGIDTTNESVDFVVEPGDSIQAAVDNASSGDTVEIQAGTYEQSVEIDKPLTLVGSGEVILDGNSLGDTNGITATTSEVTIEGLTVRRFEGVGIDITGDSALTRDVTIRNVTSRLNGANGLDVTAATDTSELTVADSRIAGNGFNGLSTANGQETFDTVNITGTTVENNDNQGVVLRGTTVTVRDAVVTGHDAEAGDFEESEDAHHGIEITRAETVTIEDVVARDNRGSNIVIDESSDNEPLSRDVTLRNITATRSLLFDFTAFSGIFVDDATEDDTITVRNVSVTESGFDGLNLNAETITVEDATVDNNDNRGLFLTGTTVTVRDTSVTGHDTEAGDFEESEDAHHGIEITRAETVTIEDVVARDNRGSNIVIDENDDNEPLSREVTLRNITATRSLGFDFTGFTGIFVGDATEDDTITVRNVSVTESGFNGLGLNAETITAEDVEARNNDDRGLSLTGTTVTVRDAVVTGHDAEAGDFEDSEDAHHGIDISRAENVTIEDAVVRDSRGHNIIIDENDDNEPLNRDVTLRNVTATRSLEFDFTGFTGVFVSSATEEDTITASNVSVTESAFTGLGLNADNITVEDAEVNNNDGAGLSLDGTAVTVRDAEVRNNGDKGLSVTGTTVTVRDAVVTGHDAEAGDSDDFEDAHHGINISRAESVTIENAVVRDSRGNNIIVDESDDNAPPTRDVVIQNVTATRTLSFDGAEYTGVFVSNATGDETITASNVSVEESGYDGVGLIARNVSADSLTARNNGNTGLNLSGTTIDVRDSNITANGDTAVAFGSIGDRATVRNSSLTDSPTLLSNDGDTVVDARQNWWGDPAGPSAADIVGNVTVSDPLVVPHDSGLTGRLNVTLSPSSIEAETETNVTATVTDYSGTPVAGATLSVSEANVSATTDDNGEATRTANPDTTGNYTVSASADGYAGATAVLTVAPAEDPIPAIVGSNPAQDLDGDGRYEDINGDGASNIVDVNALFQNLGSESLANNVDAFDFNGDGSVNIVDVNRLFQDSG